MRSTYLLVKVLLLLAWLCVVVEAASGAELCPLRLWLIEVAQHPHPLGYCIVWCRGRL